MFPERPRLLNIHAAIRPRSTDDLASLRAGRPDQPRTAQKKTPAVSTGVFSVLQPACPLKKKAQLGQPGLQSLSNVGGGKPRCLVASYAETYGDSVSAFGCILRTAQLLETPA